MKNILFILISLFFDISSLKAQTTFTMFIKLEPGPYFGSSGILINEMDSFYSLYHRGSGFVNIAKDGSQIKKYFIINSYGTLGFNNIAKKGNNIIFLTRDLLINATDLISITNGLDSVLISSSYLSVYPTSINIGRNNGFYISGACNDSLFYYYPTLLEVDSLGNLQNSYLFSPYDGHICFAYSSLTNDIICGLNSEVTGASILRMDTPGTIKWAKSLFRPYGFILSSVQNADESITLLCKADTSLSTQNHGNLFLVKIDSSGSVLWCKSYGDSTVSFVHFPPSKLRQTADGGYIICTSTYEPLAFGFDNNLILIKTDAFGDTLWTRTYGSHIYLDFGCDVIATSDGGYISSGKSYPNFTAYGGYFIVKTDSLGSTASHCVEFSTPFTVANFLPNDSLIYLTDTMGVIIQGVPNITDTVLPNPAFVDGCNISGIFNEFTNKKTPLLPYPNPTSGIFTLKNLSASTPVITIIIYDILGNEILTEKNITHPEPMLDLSQHPPGMYYIKVIQGSNVEVVKVVVQ